MRCPALKMAIRTHMQLKMSVSKVRHRDHQVHRKRKMKKYTAEVIEGSMTPADAGTEDVKSRGLLLQYLTRVMFDIMYLQRQYQVGRMQHIATL